MYRIVIESPGLEDQGEERQERAGADRCVREDYGIGMARQAWLRTSWTGIAVNGVALRGEAGEAQTGDYGHRPEG